MQNLWFYLSACLLAVAISLCFMVLTPYVVKWVVASASRLKRMESNWTRRAIHKIGRRAWHYVPWTARRHLRQVIHGDEALYVIAAQHMLGKQVLIAGLMPLGFVAVRWVLALKVNVWWVPVAVLFATLAPYLQYRSQQRKYQRQLRHQLPFFLDIFALSVEAGAGTVLALQTTAEALPEGLLKNVIERTVFDMRSGLSREHSFKKLAVETGVDEMEALASSIENAVQMGLSLAPVLRAQSDQYRQERFLRAEKAALEAPVKMLFPIVSCIFPCTFLVIAYPIVHRLLSSF